MTYLGSSYLVSLVVAIIVAVFKQLSEFYQWLLDRFVSMPPRIKGAQE